MGNRDPAPGPDRILTPREVVLAFWEAMRTNDFAAASLWLSPDFEGLWPQSGEVTRGRENFAAVNSQYPASGPWTFTLNDIVCEGHKVVTDMSIGDGKVAARAITFHEVEGGLIRRQLEFWPDPFDAPEWRRAWVERRPPS